MMFVVVKGPLRGVGRATVVVCLWAHQCAPAGDDPAAGGYSAAAAAAGAVFRVMPALLISLLLFWCDETAFWRSRQAGASWSRIVFCSCSDR